MSRNDWKKLSYTGEESEELERLSMLGGAGDIDAHVADKILRETIKKYELKKENKSMSNTTNFEKVLGKKNANMGEAMVNVREDLGKSLKELLVDAYDKFSRWMETSQSILEELKSAKESIEIIEELDNVMAELTKVSNETVLKQIDDLARQLAGK